MKLNPSGFNLNFDEFSFAQAARRGVAFGVLGLSGVDASKWCAGIAFGETRRPGGSMAYSTDSAVAPC
jgi:hypothetical protein